MALSMTTLAFAQEAAPATGLGQAWPNATDVSTNAHYHVYRFERDGVKYIQVNDLQGQVRAAVAITQDAMFALPVGTDAQHVTILTQPAPQDSTQVVYQDSNMAVAAVPQEDGSVSIMAMMADCTDPGQCTLNRVAQ
ncbi:hypothetical protein GCM10010981_42960 [Dyella nitratireducens]|uniref:Uncharacterized protein n=2 Tax=Dyella nitratireducens TaxID=1849580 RepID=A0ABQ1GRL8_9GAMM|nr:hypothetical protein GCM10010981_42960 [Dyella nitratireducens]GLQ42227.1 hypothetical protein GCM10007902_20770 [Dyella nitratireducens]